MVEEGLYSTLMRTGRFCFAVRSGLQSVQVRAVNFDGRVAEAIPVEVRDGFIRFDLDTSVLGTVTPYFEVVSRK